VHLPLMSPSEYVHAIWMGFSGLITSKTQLEWTAISVRMGYRNLDGFLQFEWPNAVWIRFDNAHAGAPGRNDAENLPTEIQGCQSWIFPKVGSLILGESGDFYTSVFFPAALSLFRSFLIFKIQLL